MHMDRPRAISRVLLVLDGGSQPVDDCANPSPASRLGLTPRCPSRPEVADSGDDAKPCPKERLSISRACATAHLTARRTRLTAGARPRPDSTNADSHPFRTGTKLVPVREL